MRAAIFLILLAPFYLHAFEGVRSEYQALNSMVNASKVTASEAISTAANGARAVGKVDFVGPGGRAVAGDLAVAMGRRSALAIGAGIMGTVALPVAAAMLAYDIYKAVRIEPNTTGGGLSHDPGLPQEQFTGWVYTVNNVQYSSPSATAQALVDYFNLIHYYGPYAKADLVYWDGGPELINVYMSVHTSPPGCNYGNCTSSQVAHHGGAYQSGQRCPAHTDPRTGAQVGAGESAPGADGKCPGAPALVQMTPDQAAAHREQFEAAQLDYGRMLREAAGLGPVTIPAEATQELVPETVTPAVIPGSTTTTTNPDGSTVEDTNEWRAGTATSIGGPNGNRAVVPWQEKKTTVTRDPQGNPTGTTTTTTGAPAVGPAASAPAADPCIANPGRVGCLLLGQPPGDEVPKRNIALAYAAESISLPSGCPPDIPLWGGHVFHMQGACDASTAMRPFILAGVAFGCLLLCVKALRT